MSDNVVSLNEFGASRRYLRADSLPLLHACRDQLIESVCRVLTRQAEAMENTLLGQAERAPLLEARNLFYDAQGMLNKRANEVIIACKREFLSAYDRAISTGPDKNRVAKEAELSLLGDDDFASTLSVNKATSRLRFNSAEQLVTLDSRMGLLLDQPHLKEDDNPLGPRMLCQAILNGLIGLQLEQKVALVLLNQFELVLYPELPSLYKTVNHYLIDKGILPDIKVGQFSRAATRTPYGQSVTDADDFNQIFDQLASSPGSAGGYGAFHWGGSIQSGLAAWGGNAPMSMMEAVGRLQSGPLVLPTGAEFNLISPEGNHANVLRQLQQSPVMLGASRVEALVVDAVAMLFDIVFDEDLIPNSLKNLLSRLQLPVLKAALQDRNFFSNRSHPARILLDVIADLASNLPPVAEGRHPHLDTLEVIIDRVVKEFDQDTVIFEIAADEVSKLEIERQYALEASLSEPIQDLQREERAEVAQVFVQDQVKQALESQPVMPGVNRFLHTYWAETLSNSFIEHGSSAPQFTSEIETMRELIWSVQPKTNMDTRLMLVRILPGMLKRLRDGLAHSSIKPHEIEQFFAELVVLHANAVRASATAVIPLPDAEPEAEVVTESHSDRVDLPPPPPPQVHVQVEIEDVYTERARALSKGDWVEFHYDDGTFRWARMAFSSDRGNYLFTDQDGVNTFSISLHRLADKLRTGQAILVVRRSITESAFSKLITFFRAQAVPTGA
ncbi:MAG: DUF1631 family protein [Thiobacillaceae bacterium]